jgi:ubiquinone/menaquinone biosynthesis C-methylase UbiE
MNVQNHDKSDDQRKVWLESMTKFVRPGRIVELGCGSGFVLEELVEDFAESIIIGVDINRKELEAVTERKFANVIPVLADMTKETFADNTFDTVIIVGCLHEVYSESGKGEVAETFRLAGRALKDKGVMIVQDFLKPSSRPVEIRLKDETIMPSSSSASTVLRVKMIGAKR